MYYTTRQRHAADFFNHYRLMRQFFFIALLALAAHNPVQAQTKPTFYETVDYIHKRVSETIGHQLKWKTGLNQFIIDASFTSVNTMYKNGKNKYMYRTKDNTWDSHYYSYKPEHIISVTEASANTTNDSPVGFIGINFISNLVKEDSRNWYHGGGLGLADYYYNNASLVNGNVSTIFIPYLKQDPTAFERIKKAILHLKALTADKDPFAN